MRYGSVASGIEAPGAAWGPLGFVPVFFAEISPQSSRVLARHYPAVPNHGDMTRFEEWPDHAIDLLAGGTPCESFSFASLQKGLDGPRGQLALTYLAIARRYKPRRILWENVPGVLSSNGGRDFAAFVGGLAELGYGWAYRVLDAVRFGTPQRSRRVFVVGDLGGWQRAAAVLFERAAVADLRRKVAGVPRIDASGLAKKQTMPERGRCWTVHDGVGHRFLTPVEAERAFGFPDDYTAGEADAARYRMIGKSIAVPVLRWIGERMQMVDEIAGFTSEGRAA